MVLGLEGGHPFIVQSTRVRFHYRSDLQQVQPFANMPEKPMVPPITERDRVFHAELDEDEANLYALSIGVPWHMNPAVRVNTGQSDPVSALSLLFDAIPRGEIPRSRVELDSHDDNVKMPGERNIVLRDDATMKIIEVDRGTGVHPVLVEEPSEDKEEPTWFLSMRYNHQLSSTELMIIPHGSAELPLSPAEHVEFRSVVRTVGYVEGAFRPDLAMEASSLSRHLASPTKEHAEAANKVLQFAKDNRIWLEYKQGAFILVAYTDAGAIGKCRDHRSQGGRIFAFADEEGQKISAWIHWESKVIHRACRSSAAAECLSAVEALDAMMWLSNMWKELTGDSLNGRRCMLTDNEGLIKKAVNTALLLEKRLRTDMSILRQGLRLGEYRITWVPDGAMLADPLSKGDICLSNNVGERSKRTLTRALRANCSFIRRVPTRTVNWEDVSRY